MWAEETLTVKGKPGPHQGECISYHLKETRTLAPSAASAQEEVCGRLQSSHLGTAGLAPERGQRGAWPTSVSVARWKSRKVAREAAGRCGSEEGASRGGGRPFLSVFAVGVRRLCRAGLPDPPVREKVAQGHEQKGVSRDLLKPGVGG